MGDLVELAGEVDRVAVREVPAVGKLHRQELVARLQDGCVDGEVRLAAGVRLDVRMLGAEKGLRTVDRKLLHDVHMLATGVKPLARITLGILVREDAAAGFHDGGQREVFRCDQLDVVLLAGLFGLHGGKHCRIERGEFRGVDAHCGGCEVRLESIHAALPSGACQSDSLGVLP
jgi:hypothetical protein